MAEPTSCCLAAGTYCTRCDLLVGLPGLSVTAVARDDDGGLTVRVESPPEPMGCHECGVIAHGHGRLEVLLVDAPAFGAPVRIIWVKRRWRCPEPSCPVGSFTEQDERVAAPRAKLTTRARSWAIRQLRREHASVNGIRRQLGISWDTAWASISSILQEAAADESRFENVTILGVDEHIWHHVSTKPIAAGGRGPKELTGMVDLTRDSSGRTKARLLDLVPGRSGPAYKNWLNERGQRFRDGVEIAPLDPFRGYKNAINDQLEDARAMLDAFHVVKLATQVVDDVRRRVQQDIHGHRGRKHDPLYRVRNILRAGVENLTDRQRARLETAWSADERHLPVQVAYLCAQQVRSAYRADTLADGRAIAEQVLAAFASCPVPEVARLGRTLQQWRAEFLGYFDTDRATNGGTEAINDIIELHRRIARGFRNRRNYRLRMLLIGGGLDHSPHTHP
jgi:transposase